MTSKWYVITGTACSGKTTLINNLSKLGYLTFTEAARDVIDEGIKEGKTLEEIRKSEIEFQRKVLEIKLRREKEQSKDRIIFFDRGVPDSIAYFKLYNFNIEEVLRFCKEKYYRKIFLLELLPFEKDYARIEDDERVRKLQILLRKAYSDLGYEVVEVPAVSVEERVKIILSNIDSL